MKRFALTVFFAAICCAAIAYAQSPAFTAAPDVIRPGKFYTFQVHSPSQGAVNVALRHQTGKICDLYVDFPVVEGENRISWDGTLPDSSAAPAGEYAMQILYEDGQSCETAFRVGAPYPMLTHLMQIGGGQDEGGFEIAYRTSVMGTVDVLFQDHQQDMTISYLSMEAEQGENSFFWEYDEDENALPAGSYALIMTLQSENGEESTPQRLYFDIAEAKQTEGGFDVGNAIIGGFSDLMESDPSNEAVSETMDSAPTPLPAAVLTPVGQEERGETTASVPGITPPYSSVDNGTYWSMTPGELNDGVIWNILMQPVTVYDGGLDTRPKTHAYMMENPDGTGARVAQLHAQSQGLNVVGEKNEHGYVLVEAFSNYDENFNPKTDQERADAFRLKRGYVKAGHLKTVEVMPDIAFVIDKLTQRMYVFENGVRTEELLIATGKIESNKYYNETIPGEYITASRVGDFPSGNMVCRMAIRINGGILLHEVPHKPNSDGTRNYSSFEGYLGTKQSHGCVRIQRLPSPKMNYNMKWIWDTLARGKPYKVIVWDDMNERLDRPETWYPNPRN